MAALLVLLGLPAACDDRAAQSDAGAGAARLPAPTFDSLPVPAGGGTGEPNLAAGPGGVYLTWQERVDPVQRFGPHALRFALWSGEAWSEPRTIVEGEGLVVNWADFPSMAVLGDGSLAVHWMQGTPGRTGYALHLAVSGDGGQSWSGPVIPHADRTGNEYGFASLAPLDDGLAVAWLDGREAVAGGPMTLRFTSLAMDGSPGRDLLLDDRVCDCCQTSLAVTDAGPVVAYRDRTEEEVRDIYVARHVDGRWLPGRPVHDDGWVIDACPVNGPAVDAAGERVAVAWSTVGRNEERSPAGATGPRRQTARVLVAFSTDSGTSFGAPVRVDEGRGLGRVDLALLEDGSALVSWLEKTGDGARILARRVSSTASSDAVTVAPTAAGYAGGFPRMARWRSEVVLAWTHPGDPPRVQAALTRIYTGGSEADR